MTYAELRAKGTPGKWNISKYGDLTAEGGLYIQPTQNPSDTLLIAHWSKHFDKLLEAARKVRDSQIGAGWERAQQLDVIWDLLVVLRAAENVGEEGK